VLPVLPFLNVIAIFPSGDLTVCAAPPVATTASIAVVIIDLMSIAQSLDFHKVTQN
jgi:hypothetical protein